MPSSGGKLTSRSNTAGKSGKDWIEFLCGQLGVNAYQLRNAISAAKRRAGSEFGEEDASPMSVSKVFLGDTLSASDAVQHSVRSGVRWLAEKKLTSAKWSDTIHSYESFVSGSVPISSALPLNVKEKDHAERTQHYSGIYLMIRKNFMKKIVAEQLVLDGKNRSTADFGIRLCMREAKGVDGWKSFTGYAHATKASIWGYGVHQCDSYGDHECLSISIARNTGENADALLGLLLRRSSEKQGPVAHQVLLVRISTLVAEMAVRSPLVEIWQERIDAMDEKLDLASLRINESVGELLEKLRMSGLDC